MSKKKAGSSAGSSKKVARKIEGISAEAQMQAIKEGVARQLGRAMKKRKISKNQMASQMKTSRAQVDRLLDEKANITLASLVKAATLLDRKVKVEFN